VNPVTTTAKINAKAVNVTADDQTTTYGSADPAFTFQVSGLVGVDSLSGVSCDVGVPHTDAGSYPISCTGNTNSNYAASYVNGTLTVAKGSQTTVTVTAPSSASYGQTGLTATATGGSGSGAYSFSAGASTACSVDASTGALTITAGSGSCAITATRAADINYAVSSPSAPANITVASAAVTVTFTADDKTYDGTTAATVSNCVIASGRIGTDDLTCSVSAGTFASPDASASAQTVSATATLGGAAAANYTVVNPVTATATINAKAAVVTADDQTMTSGSDDPAFTFQVSGLVGGDSLTGVSCDVAGVHTAAGTYPISCTGNTNTNYAVDSYVDGTLTVLPAEPEE
jgi:hypothetical protein